MALQATLNKIITSGLKDQPEVQDWLKPFESSGTIPAPLTLDLTDIMVKLGLDGWDYVTMNTDPQIPLTQTNGISVARVRLSFSQEAWVKAGRLRQPPTHLRTTGS